MIVEVTPAGVGFSDPATGISLGPAVPGLVVSGVDRVLDWRGTLTPTGPSSAVATVASSGLRVEVETSASDAGASARARARVVNSGDTGVRLERFTVAATAQATVGEPRRWRILRNGYQSWSGSWTIGVDERDRDLPTRFGRAGATDAKHPSPTGVGHVRSDALTAVVDDEGDAALAIGFTTLGDAFAFVEVDAPHGRLRSIEAWVDLDDVELAPGEVTPWFEIAVAAANRPAPALRAVAGAAASEMGARHGDGHHPSGWCSWYYYFTKVSEDDVDANLAVLAADGRDGPEFGCQYVMVDDGHQAAIGDWLTTNAKFPSGMAAVADRITAAGFDAGIWWAPFIVSARSAVAAEHPEWLVRNERGRPVLGLLNPGWGLTTPMWVLDTTRPDVLDHVRHVAAVIGDEWGYRIQKIDFLYAAALPGRRHDASATRAQALRRGLEAVREGAGDDAFVLGCGCPLGPAVGLVDAMRIGADVTPSWTSLIGRTVGRNRHALATAHALANTLTRSFLDGIWFLNDPDCLMVRDTDTELTEPEVRLMSTIFGMTDGMVVLSDRMDRLSPARRALVRRTMELTGGDADVVDLFAHDPPRVVVSRHPDRVDVAVVNLTSGPLSGRVPLDRVGVTPELVHGAPLREWWSDAPVTTRDGHLDLGTVAPHDAKVVQFRRSRPGDQPATTGASV